MGEASERNPIAEMAVGEGPGNLGAAQAPRHVRIPVDGLIVIVIDEPEVNRLREYQPDRQQQQATDRQRQDRAAVLQVAGTARDYPGMRRFAGRRPGRLP